MPQPRTVSCPQCGAPVAWTPASRFRPFCSERCRLIDLGAWASESYRVPVTDDVTDAGDQRGDDQST
ncbi:MAG TPA: DNA gyrase inhibitor YacG [Casimicrobiaceae bacterium]|nr:DNA gyrase inhibitor YacG [Casimicrobiaceae bacterium]